MKKILLAVDDSKKSEKAAKKIGELVISPGTEITIIHVVTPFNVEHPDFASEKLLDDFKNKLEEKGYSILEQTEALLNDVLIEKDIDIKKVLKIGKPADNILELSENKNYDLLIVSSKSKRKNKIDRYHLGGTSDKIIRHAKIPVLVLKKDKCF